MRFRPSRTPPPYLNRRDQFRMLAMVGLLALVLFAMKFAAKPSTWYWLTGPPEKTAAGGQTDRAVSHTEIDFGVQLEERDPLPPGVFRSVKPETEPDADTSLTGDRAHDVGFEIEVDPDLLAGIKDNTLGVRNPEQDAYNYLLAKTRAIPSSDLEKAARKNVAFAVLMLESDRFRGELVTIDGKLRRLTSLKATKNDYGLDQLYEAWVFNADSGSNPYCIVCTSVPDGIAQGHRIEQPVRVRVTGYFFKRYGYGTANNRFHVAPLILAKRLRWFPAQTTVEPDTGLAPYVLGFVLFVGVSLAITLWRFTVSDKKFYEGHLKRLTEAPQEAISALDGVETTDVSEFFRSMSDREKSSETPGAAADKPQD